MPRPKKDDILWNQIMIREFESLACLSEEERIVLHDWAFDIYIAQTRMQSGMSETKIKDIRSRLRRKYDDVQPFTPLLPPRIQ